jgi:hypothetical protein
MAFRSFFGRLRKIALRIALGRDLFYQVTSTHTDIQGISNQLNDIQNRLNDIQTFKTKIDEVNSNLQQGILQINNNFSQQIGSLSGELSKVKRLQLVKEVSPKLVKNFASGLPEDDDFVDRLSATNIFFDIQTEFKNISGDFLQFITGAYCQPTDKITNSLLCMMHNPLLKPVAFSRLVYVFIQQHNDDKKAKILEKIYDESFLDTDTWSTLIYISYLILRKEEDKALYILKGYLRMMYPLDALAGLIPVADLAHRNGFTNPNIEAASKLFQTIQTNVENKMLEKYVKNKTMAIVGNGAHELGTGNGTEIDSHDIVVRFNNFNESSTYIKDYGAKTNIIFQGNDINSYKKNCDIMVFIMIYSMPFSLDFIREYSERPKVNLTTIENSIAYCEIQKKYNLFWPSSGFRALYYFKETLKLNIKSRDVYGFSFNYNKPVEGHYEGYYVRDTVSHDMDVEIRAAKEILGAE